MKHRISILLASALMLLSGCAVQRDTLPAPEMAADTRALMDCLTLRNAELETFKGMGTVRFNPKTRNRRTARVAWIGKAPDKLRLSILNIGGMPTTTMAADGDYFFMASHAPKNFYKTRSQNPSLKKLIGMELKAREVIQILRGQVPLREFDQARAATDPRTGARTLILSSRRGRVLEKVYFESDNETPAVVEMFDPSGRIGYTLKFSNVRDVGGFSVPFRIDITGGEDRLLLKIERYWARAEAPPSTFMLVESEM
ncbi:DUF4292 domain-containing protein [Desulfococcus sp.]|uniref:DUF4292 domain-containing protein n=1 Tax=Desulfococcus sp. TaxID=2025834 RepID=UPI0035935BEA